MKLLSTVIFMLFLVVSVYGQGAYLERGNSGIGLGAGFSTNKDARGIGGSIGYSISGIFDIGIAIGSFSFDEKLLDADLSATVVSPSLAFYALKQNEEIPLSLVVSAGYDWQIYSNDVLDNNNIDMTGGFFSIGGSLFRYFQASNSLRIQPSIGFYYFTGEVKLKGNNVTEESNKDDTTVFNLGFGLAFNTSPDNIFIISPNMSISEGTKTFGVGLSFILGTK